MAGVAAAGLVGGVRPGGGLGRAGLLRGRLPLVLGAGCATAVGAAGCACAGAGAACGSPQAPWEAGIRRRSSSSGACSEGSR
ncbi:hypothetical protein ID875_22515 [Streptomyces globisporus]|uniref:Uncharacterized protein n=1 Tax=Streptomyces globisporus TaxID=1908 RepID=A0A927GP31_STRGL|nr:hypothetical protein [Streptomyces globisporus]